MDKTSLGDRMKGYESVSRTKLIRRTPVIIRIDGKAFHTWTRSLVDVNTSPFSGYMNRAMTWTCQQLVNNIQNAKIAYTQSDEISILLNDWGKIATDQWFDGNIQKIVSVSASIATAAFNHFNQENNPSLPLAYFDSRAFALPKEEVANYFIWRQQDATRNSVQMLGRFYFSHKEMHQKSVSDVQDMLMLTHDVNWNNIDTWMKRGSCVVPSKQEYNLGVDLDIPIFTQDRDYIEKHLKEDE